MEQVDVKFHELLRQRGSKLIQAVQQEQIVGDVKYMRQYSVGQASFVTDTGGITQYKTIDYARRRLQPKEFEHPISLNDFDLVRQGMPDTNMIATQMADACGVMIDKIIINGLGGTAYTESGSVALPDSQLIRYGETSYTKTGSDAQLIECGLSASKVAKAVTKLKSAFVNSPIVIVANERAMATLRADTKAANSDFNSIQAFSAGIMNPYAGVSAFVQCEQVDTFAGYDGTGAGTPAKHGAAVTSAGKYCTYAYAYALDQVILGTNMPLFLKAGQNPERGFNDALIYKGAYDCTRMQEKAVVRIEIAHLDEAA